MRPGWNEALTINRCQRLRCLISLLLALGALRYCSKNGLRVPEDVAIVGFDNIEFGEYAVTPISTINYDVARVTALAVERVLELIAAKGELPEARVTQVEPELVVRESSNQRYSATG